MKGFRNTWEGVTDDEERQILAQNAHDMAVNLIQSDAWIQLQDALAHQVSNTMKDLARSSNNDERNRGVIDALTHVLSMPDNLVRAARKELDK